MPHREKWGHVYSACEAAERSLLIHASVSSRPEWSMAKSSLWKKKKMNNPSLSLSFYLSVCVCLFVCDTVHENRVGVRAIRFIPSLDLCRLHAHFHIRATSVYGKLAPKCRRVPCSHNSFIFPLSDLSAYLLVQPELLVIHICFPADQSSSPKCLLLQASDWPGPSTHTLRLLRTMGPMTSLHSRSSLSGWFCYCGFSSTHHLSLSVFFFSLFLKKTELLRQCFHPPLLLDIFPALSPLFCVSINIVSSV